MFILSKWVAEKYSLAVYDSCEDPSKNVSVCLSPENLPGMIESCGDGLDGFVISMKDDGSCGTRLKHTFFFLAQFDSSDYYDILSLSFEPFVPVPRAVIDGKVVDLSESSVNASLEVAVEFDNPFSNVKLAKRGSDISEFRVGTAQSTAHYACDGFCAVMQNETGFSFSRASCFSARADCNNTSVTSCTLNISELKEDYDASVLPYKLDDSGPVLMGDQSSLKTYVRIPGTMVPLNGTFSFTVANRESINPGKAATNIQSLVYILLKQDPEYEDVLILRSNGQLATSSKRCKLTMLSVNSEGSRMYSIRNQRNVTECDVSFTNGAVESTAFVPVLRKSSTAKVVTNYNSLWSDASLPGPAPDSESNGSKPKSTTVGLGLGLGLGIPALIAVGILLWCFVFKKKQPEDESAREGSLAARNTADSVGNPLETGLGSRLSIAKRPPRTNSQDRRNVQASRGSGASNEDWVQDFERDIKFVFGPHGSTHMNTGDHTPTAVLSFSGPDEDVPAAIPPVVEKQEKVSLSSSSLTLSSKLSYKSFGDSSGESDPSPTAPKPHIDPEMVIHEHSCLYYQHPFAIPGAKPRLPLLIYTMDWGCVNIMSFSFFDEVYEENRSISEVSCFHSLPPLDEDQLIVHCATAEPITDPRPTRHLKKNTCAYFAYERGLCNSLVIPEKCPVYHRLEQMHVALIETNWEPNDPGNFDEYCIREVPFDDGTWYKSDEVVDWDPTTWLMNVTVMKNRVNCNLAKRLDRDSFRRVFCFHFPKNTPYNIKHLVRLLLFFSHFEEVFRSQRMQYPSIRSSMCPDLNTKSGDWSWASAMTTLSAIASKLEVFPEVWWAYNGTQYQTMNLQRNKNGVPTLVFSPGGKGYHDVQLTLVRHET